MRAAFVALALLGCGHRGGVIGGVAGGGDMPAAIPTCTPMVTTPSGLSYCDFTVGNGAVPAPGTTVIVHYTGWLADGEKFDSSVDRGQPFEFAVGTGMVIKGWDEGVGTMAIGGHRLLLIPPALGYGKTGAGHLIPPDSMLIFDVQLLGAEPQ